MKAARRFLLAAVLLGAASSVAAQRSFAVISLVGDRVEVVVPRQSTGSSVDRNLRDTFKDGAGSFDRIALGAVANAVDKAQPGATTTLLALPPNDLHEDAERLFDGNRVLLPASVAAALAKMPLTHLLLLTKQRADARVPITEGHTGMGKVQGVGFYVDRWFATSDAVTGEGATGFLAPFVYIRLTLVELASGRVQGQQSVTTMQLLPVTTRAKSSDPWDLMPAAEKASLLKGLLEDEIARLVPAVLGRR